MILTDNRRLNFGPILLKNRCIVFERLDGVTPDEMRKGKIKYRYEHVNVHMIFDIKMDGKFTNNEILVANIHTTAPPPLGGSLRLDTYPNPA